MSLADAFRNLMGEGFMLLRCSISFIVLFLFASNGFATVFGTLRGIVHDAQHRPVAGTDAVLKAADSDYTRSTKSNADGDFQFDAVLLGDYIVTITKAGSAPQERRITVLSGRAPVLHVELQVATQTQSITVTSEAPPAQTESVTPTTLTTQPQIMQTPGASKSNSLALIMDYVLGAYYAHDQLHIRGGHQVSWLIDGASIPNTNIASNLGPQVDPKDIHVLETPPGSYSADYGDRTLAVRSPTVLCLSI